VIEPIGFAAALVALAIVAFAVSVRLGILLGRGLDRRIEAQRNEEAVATSMAADPPAVEPEEREDALRD
jgi:hypothetical protein